MSSKTTRLIYYTLVKLVKPSVTSQTWWNEVFPINAEDQQEYWASVYRNPYKAARDTKLQAFHFRIVHRFLPCNKFLKNKNIHINRDDRCSFCPASDTLEHFMFYCPMVVAFRGEVTSWFSREADIHINVSLRAFLFGIPDSTPHAKFINFTLLFIKFFIYHLKLFHQGSMNIIHFLRDFRARLQMEKYLTRIEQKQHKFIKWQRIYDALG